MNKKIFLFAILCALGLTGNYFKVPLFFGVEVIFGSIAALLIVAILGTIPGTLAGFLIGSMTWFLWGHPYAMIIFGLEALFVGFIYKNPRNLALIDGLYWLLIGVPLVFIFYGGMLGLDFSVSSTIATKQALNGVMNAVVVALLLIVLNFYGRKLLNSNRPKVSFQKIIFNVITAAVFISAIIPSIISNSNFLRELEREALFELQTTSNVIIKHLKLAEDRIPIPNGNAQEWLARQFGEIDLDVFVGFAPVAASAKSTNGDTLATLGNVKSNKNGKVTISQSGLIDLWMPSADLAQMKLWRASQYQFSTLITLANGFEFYLITEMPTNAIMDRYNDNSYYMLLLMALMLGLALGFAHFLSKLITLPIRNIAAESKQISQNLDTGVPPTISPSTLYEFDLMVQSLQSMSKEITEKFHDLNAIRDTLEKKVRERTKELNKLAIVARQISNAVVITNLAGKIEWVNNAFIELTGYDLNEIVGKTPGSFLQGKDSSSEAIKMMSKALQNKEAFSVELINYTKEGKPYWVEISCSPMFNDNGNIAGFIAIEANIDHRKNIEFELEQNRAALQKQLQETLNARSRIETQAQELANLAEREALARIEAESAEHAKAEFLASMSHEIRTPMTGVMGFANMLLDDQLPAASHDKVVKIIETSKSLLTIINDILDISKIDAGKLQIERIDFNPIEVVQNLVQLFEQTDPYGSKEALDITVHFSDDFPSYVNCDPTRLRQILVNLIGNAVKFTDRGSVTVNCKNDSQNQIMQFEISDTGIGMSAEDQKKLFQNFSQADASISRKYQGTGLGLAICKRLVELLGGEIKVESVIGQGSTFTFTTPYSISSTQTAPSDENRNTSEKQVTQQLKVLVAEDNEINRTIVEAILVKLGHVVTFAHNGIEAITAVKANDFDLILMDVRMPEMSGPEATMQIRSLDSDKAGIPIIALTADAMSDHQQTYIDAGMNSFVSKPIIIEELVSAINKVMNSEATNPDVTQAITTEDVPFDFKELAARIGLTEETLLPLLQRFVQDYSDFELRLKQLTEDNQYEHIINLTHEFKGVSGNLRFEDIYSLASEVETNAKDGDSEALTKNIELLSASLEKVTTQLKSSF